MRKTSAPHCTCTNHDCEFNPVNHDEGCNRCIADSLVTKELPRCFFLTVTDDIEGFDDWSYDHFAQLVTSSRIRKA